MLRRKPNEFAEWLSLPAYDSTVVDPTQLHLPILVVGAGPSGLAVMAALAQAQVPFEGVESHSDVGGIWDDSNPLSTVYEGLHLVTSRFTSFLGPPMPADWPKYPSQALALEYLRTFAHSAGLLERIRFSTRFQTAVKTAQGSWRATLQSLHAQDAQEREYRAVIIATGSHNKDHCKYPQDLFEQASAGGVNVIHSADYRSAEPYAGKRVLVLGVGNSGSDIAERVSQVAARTILSVRTSPWINPQTFGGVPCDKLVLDGNPLPEWLGMRIFLFYRWLTIGSHRRLGLTRPTYELNDRVPVSDRGFVRAIRQGQIIVRSDVAKFEGNQAVFTAPDQLPETLDAVILATGFERHYPLLPPEPGKTDRLLFYLFHRQEPGLVYMTEMVGLRSCWPIFAQQAQAVAAYFAAEQRGSRRVGEFNARRRVPTPSLKGALLRLADEYSVDYDVYTRMLREFVEWLSN